MCEPESSMSLRAPLTACGAVLALAGTVDAASMAWAVLLPVAIAVAAVALATVPLLRWLGRRVTVPRWSAAYQRQAEVQRAELPASPRPAIEAAPVHGTVLTPAEYAKIRSAR